MRSRSTCAVSAMAGGALLRAAARRERLFLKTWRRRALRALRDGDVSAMGLPLAPLWVWLAFAEVPSRASLIGGSVVAIAILWQFGGEG